MKSTLVGILVMLAFSFSALANEGVFMVVKGDIKVVAKSGGEQKAKVGMKVKEGDTIVSGADARAKVVMVDKNVLNISPDSKIAIEKYAFNEGEDKKNVSLNVIYGKVRATVNQKYDGEKNTFNVKTPSAVAGVRGTDFITSFSPVTSASKIVTFEGSVVTGSGMDARGKIMNPVTVQPGQFTVASTGQPPAAPAAVPKNELASMQRDSAAETGGDKRGPAGDSGNKGGEGKGDKGGDKGDKGGKGPEGGGSHTAGEGPAEGGGHGPASMMDNSDLGGGAAMEPKTPDAVSGVECPSCAMLRPDFPPQLPPDVFNSGRTRLIINVNQ